ncbi:E3 ubiquitin-protein ligase RNF128 isoform X2 [Polypterus senegalus]|uniref:E3 ubiquitin-protein ligase RNF128 isoform X2 n=1 Tax=Polypterus senegalus TaxID=55291 RepID=UPI0019650FD5|nr:E3 ubiquitin-protein ligase RNF128 isoform X2 [Polypterus senegalus]
MGRGVALLLFLELHYLVASTLWTADVQISYDEPSNTDIEVSELCSCGLYGLNSPIRRASGLVVTPAFEERLACDNATSFDNQDSEPWIALIERGNCTFTEKINLATRAGASVVVIYNYNVDGLSNDTVPMKHEGTKNAVAIMINHFKGMEIVKLLAQGIKVYMVIDVGKMHGSWIGSYSIFFVSIAFFVVTAVTVGYFIYYSARRLRNARAVNRRQKKLKAEAMKVISQLQLRTLKQGDKETGSDGDSCAVCIEVYKPNDIVRILTCNHLFHKTCIDPWLLEHRTCPMCKCDILKSLGIEPDVEEAATETDPSAPEYPTDQQQEYTTTFPDQDNQSETVSSGYASVREIDERLGEVDDSPVDTPIQVDVMPHYDNFAFEEDEKSRQAKT